MYRDIPKWDKEPWSQRENLLQDNIVEQDVSWISSRTSCAAKDDEVRCKFMGVQKIYVRKYFGLNKVKEDKRNNNRHKDRDIYFAYICLLVLRNRIYKL